MKPLSSIAALLLLVCPAFAAAPHADDRYRTPDQAVASRRPNPIAVRHVYGADRDWVREPFQLAVILVEFRDRTYSPIHSRAMYEEMLFSRDRYHKTPSGDVSFGSVADWYRTQSQGRFILSGKVFDWLKVDETFDAIHSLKLADAQQRYLRVALDTLRSREGAKALDKFDGYLFIHVGPITGPAGNIFWSHRADIEGRRYITTGEIETIGVVCHEFGHMLGLPDFYAKKGVREGFGPWCAMASGYRGKYPKSFGAWSKTRLGWCRPTVVDATLRQKLALRPIQTHPDDALIVPLNDIDGVGTEFLLLENRTATGNDAEGQAGLFIWHIRRKADNGLFPVFELKLPGPDDAVRSDANTRRVAWPTAKASDFLLTSESLPHSAAIRNIRMDGDRVLFDLGPD